MKYLLLCLLLLTDVMCYGRKDDSTIQVEAQFALDVYNWQLHYKQEHVADARSPVKTADTGYLQFYAPDARYRVLATFIITPDAKPFDIATHSGETRPYRQYGLLTFVIDGKKCSLQVYQSLNLIKQEALKDYLFIPFNDLTNYETTYAGGRYLDLRIGDIRNRRLVLDFNKAYNPYCAFGDGFSCPIPPDANRLKVAIKAGEKLWSKPSKD